MEKKNNTELSKLIMKVFEPMLGLEARESKVIEYYLKNNFEKLYGTNSLGEDEADIVHSSESVEINDVVFGNIVSNSVYIILDGDAIKCVSLYTGDVLFRIKYLNNQLVNDYFDTTENVLYHYNTEPDKHGNETFAYSEKNTETDEVVYDASMIPVGNKQKDREMFEIKVAIPVIQEEQSLLKRLYDSLVYGTLVAVQTDRDIVDMYDYVENVYNQIIKYKSTAYARENNQRKLSRKSQN